ncbi:unnamed protein product, partial [Brachionus calyciflorus]
MSGISPSVMPIRNSFNQFQNQQPHQPQQQQQFYPNNSWNMSGSVPGNRF